MRSPCAARVAFQSAHGALRLSGTYTVSGDAVTVTLNLIRDGKKLASFQVAGDRRDTAELLKKLAAEVSAVFHLSDRTLTPGASPTSEMRPPRTEAPGLSFADWEDTDTPRLNNTPLKLDPYETSRSLAIAPDGERFLLGTDYWLRLFNRSLQEVWPKPVPVPGVAWAVNISADGRPVVAAGD